MFFSSLGSLGSSRILSSSSICASSRLQARDFVLRHGAQLGVGLLEHRRELLPGSAGRSSIRDTLSTVSDSSLCSLVTLRYCAESLMTDGSAICAVSSSKRRSISSSFGRYCMGRCERRYATTSSPPCLASSSIAPFKAWIATAACESSGGLGGDALEPQARPREHAHQRALARGGEADQLIAQTDHQRQQARCARAASARTRRSAAARR